VITAIGAILASCFGAYAVLYKPTAKTPEPPIHQAADQRPDLAKFCRDHGYIGVVNTRAEMGGGADYPACKPAEHKCIAVAQACLEQFGEQFSRALPNPTKLPYQWVCLTNAVTRPRPPPNAGNQPVSRPVTRDSMARQIRSRL